MLNEHAKEPDAPAAKLSPADWHPPLTTGTLKDSAHTVPTYGFS